MKQMLGSRKHKLCERIAGKSYTICYTTRQHNVAECWFDEHNADYVNYKVNYSYPTIRNGQRVHEYRITDIEPPEGY